VLRKNVVEAIFEPFNNSTL